MNLEKLKCDDAEFQKAIRRIDEHMRQEDVTMGELINHNKQLDIYIDKYQPARTQKMITDSLLTCLTGSMRRSHEKYIEQKMSNLYKIILFDDGESLKIAKLIEKATVEAQSAIDKAEREKREQATVLIASQSLDSTDMKRLKVQEEEANKRLGKTKPKASPA